MTLPKTVRGQMGVLAGVVGVVLLCVLPWSVRRLGSVGVLAAVVSAVCCLLPGCLLFLLQNRLGRGSLVVPLLVGVTARAGCFVLGVVGLHVWCEVPLEPLLLVSLGFYLAALACETWVLSPPSGKPSSVNVRAGVHQSEPMIVAADLSSEAVASEFPCDLVSPRIRGRDPTR